jgi:hypothetical protein
MKLNSMKKIGGATLGLLLFLGITFVSSTTAQAQYWPNQDQYRRQQRELERQQRERQRQVQRQRQTQQQQGGWYDQYGNYHQANQGYYNQGYNRGRTTDNYSNFGGSYQSRQTALNAGYNEGVKAGREDRQRGRYNPQGHSAYSSASKDYNSRYGDRASYAQYFREAFINGYADGYRGY